ncbi:MAG: hypothetical protein LBL65_08710 [Campylobacteraceae bacterium]|jgi:hypothetical protein|nr:hypothetical protein [Campylobacteraceae bacterium]
MALEIDNIVIPDNYVLVFDELSKLDEEKHEKAFSIALHKFLNCIDVLMGKNTEIMIPGHFINHSNDNIWISIQSLISNLEYFSHSLYFADDFEFSTRLKCGGKQYKIYFCSDPVVFSLKVDKSKHIDLFSSKGTL